MGNRIKKMRKILFLIVAMSLGFVLASCDGETLPSFSFADKEITIEVGETYQIDYSLSESVDVTWIVTPEDILEITDSTVKGVKVGDATIKVSIEGVEFKDSLTVHVVDATVDVSSITVSGDETGLVGETITLTASVMPENATDKTVVWTSSDETLATVSDLGVVTLLKAGTVTITATSNNALTDTIDIVISEPVVDVSSITVSGNETGLVGESITLTAAVMPENATDKTVVWTSSDETLATVSDLGVVTLLKAGTVTITVTSNNALTDTIDIVISEPVVDVSSITVSGDETGLVGETITLTAVVMPENATDKTVAWTSSDETLATVSDLGVVTLLKTGTVTITATSSNQLSVTHDITITESQVSYVAYINDQGYETIQDAIDAANGETSILIAAGMHSENLTINQSNLSFSSLSEEVAILEGVITISDGMSHISFTHLAFTNGASIVAAATIDDFTFMNNDVYDTTLEASAYLPTNRVDVQAFIRFYTLSGTNVVGDVRISDNTFTNMSSDIISIARTSVDKTIVIENNTFMNYPNTAIRFDGGYNNGDYIIKNNIFKNENTPSYGAIGFRAYSPSAGNIQNIYIEENIFDNVGDETLNRTETYPGSAAIAFSTFNDKETHIYINHNDFLSTFNALHLRNVTSTSNWHAEIHGNQFIAPKGYVLFETLDAANFNQNYILDEQNQVITDEETLETLIIGNTQYDQMIYKDIDLVMYRLDQNIYEQQLLVDQLVTEMLDGEIYTFEGSDYIVGQTVFATIADALFSAQPYTTIFLNSGTYEEDFAITKDGMMFVGPNEGVDPILGTRQSEAVLTGKITINEQISYTTFSGLAFSGDAQIKNNGVINNFLFKYNKVDSNLSYANGSTPQGFIEILSANDSDISENIILTHNQFDYTNTFAPRYLLASNIKNLYIVDNSFDSSIDAFTDIVRITGTNLDNQAGLGITGDLFVYDNVFTEAGQSAFFITTYTQIDARFIHNEFNNIRTSAIRMRYSDDVANESHILFNYNKVTFDAIYEGYPNAALRIQNGASGLEVYAHYNHFVTIANDYYIGVYEDIGIMDARYNFYEGETDYIPLSEHFSNVTLFSDYYSLEENLPQYDENLVIYVETLNINNKIETLDELDTHVLDVSYTPDNATHTKLLFTSSDETVATINAYGEITALHEGITIIRVYSKNDPLIFDEFELEVKAIERMKVDFEDIQVLAVNDNAQLNVEVFGTTNTPTFTSSDESILTITDAGAIVALSEGSVDVTVTLSENTEEVFHIYVYSDQTDPLLTYLLKQSKGVIDHDLITYIGSNDGSLDYEHLIGESVNNYLFNEILDITQNRIPTTNGNYTGDTMSSIEWIVIHDTANTGTSATAQANSNWAKNPANSSSSWHYTVGNDGYFQQLEDTMVAWHAGDGTSVEFAFYKTDIVADEMFPYVSVSDDGYYEIDGVKTSIAAPLVNGATATTEDIVTNGIRAIIGDDGYYYLPLTYQTSGYGGHIAMHGGNLNSIGIESAVNKGSDVWLTWQKSAKLIASLLITHDLSIDRVVTHNHFSGKTCPRTMMESNHLDDFYEMIEAEYEIMSQYSNYTIEFESNSSLIDDQGRIVEIPDVDTVVDYTITITTPDNQTFSVNLSTVVKGILFQ